MARRRPPPTPRGCPRRPRPTRAGARSPGQVRRRWPPVHAVAAARVVFVVAGTVGQGRRPRSLPSHHRYNRTGSRRLARVTMTPSPSPQSAVVVRNARTRASISSSSTTRSRRSRRSRPTSAKRSAATFPGSEGLMARLRRIRSRSSSTRSTIEHMFECARPSLANRPALAHTQRSK